VGLNQVKDLTQCETCSSHSGLYERGRNHLEEQGVDGRNVKLDLQEVGCGGMDWIELVQDRDR
jgi:hypothetical protein